MISLRLKVFLFYCNNKDIFEEYINAILPPRNYQITNDTYHVTSVSLQTTHWFFICQAFNI